MRRLAPVLVVAVALAGCSFGAGPERAGGGVQLHVTRDFGKSTLATGSQAKVRASDTVMRLLQGNAKITTRYGGGFVQSIDGIAGDETGGRRDWFYFVNGTEAPTGAADRKLAPGDVVQWDYRRWDATPHVPAIVGAFPEPFLHGQQGTRYPTRVECANGETACSQVLKRLGDAGIGAGSGVLGAESRGGVLRIEVGKWSEIRKVQGVEVLEQGGPAKTGVYAQFDGANGALWLLDELGRRVRRTAPGTGLVAAILPEGQQPVWVVTGLDEAGVARAAALLSASGLRNAYAVAAEPSGPVRLPLAAGG
jgi:hypothetical protein